MGKSSSLVVQDFVHQQYHSKNGTATPFPSISNKCLLTSPRPQTYWSCWCSKNPQRHLVGMHLIHSNSQLGALDTLILFLNKNQSWISISICKSWWCNNFSYTNVHWWGIPTIVVIIIVVVVIIKEWRVLLWFTQVKGWCHNLHRYIWLVL